MFESRLIFFFETYIAVKIKIILAAETKIGRFHKHKALGLFGYFALATPFLPTSFQTRSIRAG
jgi:hypothetical protein